MIDRSILIVVRGLSLGIAEAACVLLVGCGDSPSMITAQYDDYSFSRWGDDQRFQAFGVHFKGVNHKPPSIEVMLPGGRSFNCESVTVKSAEELFHDGVALGSSTLEKELQEIKYEDDPVTIIFRGGKFDSMTIQKGGKFRFAGQKEFIVLPISEEKMIELFGKPKKYERAYASKP